MIILNMLVRAAARADSPNLAAGQGRPFPLPPVDAGFARPALLTHFVHLRMNSAAYHN